jgi:arginyl-tRNA synthetase
MEALMASKESRSQLEYKGFPLRRKDNLIYYGSMADKYIIMMQIVDTKKVKEMDVATKVIVQLQLTDPNLKSRDRVVKKTEKNSLYLAMDVAAVWLERAIAAG